MRAPVSLVEEWVAAFVAWDRAAGRIGENAETALLMGNRPPRPSAAALGPEARRLSLAERRLGMPLGYLGRVRELRWPDGPGGRPADLRAVLAVVAAEML